MNNYNLILFQKYNDQYEGKEKSFKLSLVSHKLY